MSYTPPYTVADGTVLTSAELEGNSQALRIYLHRGVASSDFENTPWIQTRHVQAPVYEPYSGMQHGVTGYQGGNWAGGTNIRLQFATKFLSGNGRTTSAEFHPAPQTAIELAFRQDAKVLFHYWWELENGRDVSTASYQEPASPSGTTAGRRVYVVPYTGAGFNSGTAYNNRSRCQETRNAGDGVTIGYPIGTRRPYVMTGGYGAKQGTFARDVTGPIVTTFGLSIHSLTDRCGVVNWGIALEAYYF